MAKVKFKFGLWSKYSAITNKDPDTLYFITDRGVFYKGDQPYVGIVSAVVTNSGNGESNVAVMTLTDSLGNTVTFSVPSSTALAAVKSALETALSTHAEVTGGSSTKGHVKLSDSINSTSGVSGGVAATPKAVKDAYDALVQLLNNSFAANDAMIMKGTLGTNGSVSALPTTGYSAGWTYRVATAGTYAGKVCEVGDMVVCVKDYNSSSASDSDWSVIQVNIDGAVTASANLASNQLVVGDGNNKTIKKLAAGSNGQVLQMVDGVPKWQNITIVDEKVTVEDTGTSDMYIVGAGSQTGNQKGKSKSTLKFTGGDTLVSPKFSGDGSGVTNLNPSNLSGAVPVSKGGTGATSASGARSNLGLGSAAVKNVAQGIDGNEQGLPTGAQVATAIEDSLDEALSWEELV